MTATNGIGLGAAQSTRSVPQEKSAISKLLDQTREKQQNIFMKMFLAQVKHQDIDNPMSTHEMTQSVMSFFQTEEMVQTNKLLTQGNNLKVREQLAMAKNYLNKEVSYEGDVLHYQGKEVPIQFTVPEGIVSCNLDIYDASGKIIRSIPVDPSAGEKNLPWDGTAGEGIDKKFPEGQYIVKVSGVGKENEKVEIPTLLKGSVSEILYDHDGTTFSLVINQTPVDLMDVVSVSKPPKKDLNVLSNQYEELRNILKEHLKTAVITKEGD